MSDSKKLIKNTTIYALGDIIPKFISFISFPILTRYLIPADYGIVNYINALTTFLLAIGFLCSNTYYLVHYYRCETVEDQKKLLGNLFSFVIAFNVFIMVIFLLFGKPVFALIGSKVEFYPYIVLAVVYNFFNIFAVLPSALYRLLEKPMMLTIINVANGVVTMILTFVLVIHYKMAALGVLEANLIVSFLFLFIFLYTIRRHVTWNFNFPQIKQILAFSLPLVPGTIAYYITSLSDRVLINKYLSLNDLGIYGTASTLSLVLIIFSNGAYKAFEPHIFKRWGGDGFERTFESIRNVFMYILLVGVLCLSVFSKEFFEIMTSSKFHEAYWYVPMIIIGVYCSSIGMLYGTIITAKGKTKISSLINTVGAVISILLNVLLLHKFGLIVAALVSSFTITVMMSISIWYAAIKVERVKPFLSILICAATIYFLVYVLDIKQIMLFIAVKFLVLSVVIAIISWMLAVNPFKVMREMLVKK